jgi:Zn-dependent protease with chaperone function
LRGAGTGEAAETMIVALTLLGYAALLATAGAGVLGRASWPRRAPRLAILAWQALSLSTIGSVLLAGVLTELAVTGGDAARRCGAPAPWPCSPAATPAGLALAIAAAAPIVAVTARVIWCLATTYAAARGRRNHQLDALAVLGRPDDRLGVTLIDHAAPSAYCLPGRHGRIVVTTAALTALDEDHLAAVLAHERAHLRQRHHLIRTTAEALSRAFPWVPAFTTAREQIGRLSELAADDAAARHSGRLTVAAALLALAEATTATSATPVPAPALTAGGATAATRAHRLIKGARPLGRTRVLLGLAATALVISAPAVAAAAYTPGTPSTACCTTATPHS